MAKKFSDLASAFNDEGGGGSPFGAYDEGLFDVLDDVGGDGVLLLDAASIVPDRAQPRRAIPSAVYRVAKTDDVTVLLMQWHRLACELLGRPIDVRALLNHTMDEGYESHNPFVAKYLDLLSLAASIRDEGLINPITVVKDGAVYRIVAGERRWLAHGVLAVWLEDAPKIRAIVEDDRNRAIWQQAVENNVRSDLNAIGKARQLALLIMTLRESEGDTFEPYHALLSGDGCDRAFYAQVADGTRYRIPRGMGSKLYEALGFGRSQLANYRALLTIDDAAWMYADDHDVSVLAITKWLALRTDASLQDYHQHPDMFNGLNIARDEGASVAETFGASNGASYRTTTDYYEREYTPVRPSSSSNGGGHTRGVLPEVEPRERASMPPPVPMRHDAIVMRDEFEMVYDLLHIIHANSTGARKAAAAELLALSVEQLREYRESGDFNTTLSQWDSAVTAAIIEAWTEFMESLARG